MSSSSILVDCFKYQQFQLLVQQLDDEEFESFLSKLWRRNGKDTVLQLLRPHSKNIIPQSEIISMASTIIAERYPPRRHFATKSNNIAETPSQLIGEIASFLDYSDYTSFSSTNRKMFVDCNSPNRLTKLNLLRFTDIDPSFCLKNYPKLKHLSLSLHQLPSLNISRDAITQHCPGLRTLVLDAHRGEADGAYSIDDFIADNIGRCRAITKMTLRNFEKEDALNSQQLVGLLHEFSALTRLELVGMQCDDYFDVEHLKLLCAQINTVLRAGVTGSAYAALLTALSPKLQSLWLIKCFPRSTHFPPNCDWSKLKKLSIRATCKRTISGILNRARNIRSIWLMPPCCGETRMSSDDHQSLEDLAVGMRGNLLSKIQNRKEDILLIKLFIDCKKITDTQELMDLLSKLLLTLNESNVVIWKLELETYKKSDHFAPTTVNALQSFVDLHDGIDMELMDGSEGKLMIGNRHS